MPRIAAPLLVAAFVVIGVLITPSGMAQGGLIRVPSVYSDHPAVVDGSDDEWQDLPTTAFEGLLASGDANDTLVGTVRFRNNATHLLLLVSLQVGISPPDDLRLVLAFFDENADGMFTAGDNIVAVARQGPSTATVDQHFNETDIADDPPEDTQGFDGAIAYTSTRVTTFEAAVPYTGTNDYYDLEMLVANELNIELAYQSGTGGSVFLVDFNYAIAPRPLSTLPGTGVFAAFLLTLVLIPLGLSWRSVRRVALPRLRSQTTGLLIFLALLLSSALVVLAPGFGDAIVYWLEVLTATSEEIGLGQALLLSAMLGALAGLLETWLLRQTARLVDGAGFWQKASLGVCSGLLFLVLFGFAVAPVVLILLAAPRLGGVSGSPLDVPVAASADIMGSLQAIIVLAASFVLIQWIPTIVVLSVFGDARKTPKGSGARVWWRPLSLFLFSLLAVPSGLSHFLPTSRSTALFLLLIGPSAGAVLLSFLEAQGYVGSIRDNLGVLRHRQLVSTEGAARPLSFSSIRKSVGSNRPWNFMLLAVNVLGLSRGLFLLTIPLVFLEFPLGFSLVTQGFVGLTSGYAIATYGQTLEGAKFVYRTGWVFFSAFLLYDVWMIVRSYKEDFLAPQGRVRTHVLGRVGPSSAVAILSLVALLMANTMVLDFRLAEREAAMPTWVQQQLGIQIMTPLDLADMAFLLAFPAGIAILLGLLFSAYRWNSEKSLIDGSIAAGIFETAVPYRGASYSVALFVVPEEDYAGLLQALSPHEKGWYAHLGIQRRAFVVGSSIYVRQDAARDLRVIGHELGHVLRFPHRSISLSTMAFVPWLRWRDPERLVPTARQLASSPKARGGGVVPPREGGAGTQEHN